MGSQCMNARLLPNHGRDSSRSFMEDGYSMNTSGSSLAATSTHICRTEQEDLDIDSNINIDQDLDVPAILSRGRPKRKHVVRIVARRTLPDRYSRIRSFSTFESGLGVEEFPNVVCTKGARFSSEVPFLEPAEMLASDNCLTEEREDRSELSATESFERTADVGLTDDHQFLAHQEGDTLWPLLSQYAVDFSAAANIILGITQIAAEKICDSVPQAFTSTGSFVIDLSSFSNRHGVAMDGLGSWGKPQGASRHYKYVNGLPQRTTRADDADVKILRNRYEHPGTRSMGRFVRKIYTGNSMADGPLPLAVLVYEWAGEPHPIQLHNVNVVEPSCRPYGSRSWEARNVDISKDIGLEFDGQPLYAKAAVDFDTVARIILGSAPVTPNRLCTRIPQGFRAQGTFVIDLTKFESSAAVRKDGNGYWEKPSGCLRYYKLGEACKPVRVEKGQKLSDLSYDVQILSKRYENMSVPGRRFVRKIYTGKAVGEVGQQLKLCSLAVLTYFWKGTHVPLIVDEDLVLPLRPFRKLVEPTDGFSSDGCQDLACSQKPLEESSFEITRNKNDRDPVQDVDHDLVTNVLEVERFVRESGVEEDVVNLERRMQRAQQHTSSAYYTPDSTCLDGLVLCHSDHLKRLALAKEVENQNRFIAVLDRAEQFLARFEQVGLNLGLISTAEGHYVVDDGDYWGVDAVQNVANTVIVDGNAADEISEGGNSQDLPDDDDGMSDAVNGEFMQIQYQ